MADRSRALVNHPFLSSGATFALAVAIVTGCTAPPAAPVAAPAAAPPTPGPSIAAVLAAPAPATPAPTTAPADVGAGCPVPDQAFVPPSDQLVSLDVTTVGGVDRITFAFGPESGDPLVPEGSLRAAEPPFTFAASGQEFDVEGDRFLEIVFRGQRIADEAGQPVFQGETDRRPNLPAVRELVNFDSFEGHMSWIVGYAGGGCVTLEVDEKGGSVTLSIEHPA